MGFTYHRRNGLICNQATSQFKLILGMLEKLFCKVRLRITDAFWYPRQIF